MADEDIKSGHRSIFAPSGQEKIEFEKKNVEKKLTRHKKQRTSLEQQTRNLEGKIFNESEKLNVLKRGYIAQDEEKTSLESNDLKERKSKIFIYIF